jgi:hypothetical protein
MLKRMTFTQILKTKRFSFGVMSVLLSLLLLLIGCSSNSSSSQTTSAAATQKIKIGISFPLRIDIGLNGLHTIQLLADDDNSHGGLDIGGQKY